MNIEIRNIIIEKSRTKKDGIYSYKGFDYVVKNNSLIAFANLFGEVFACFGMFNTKIAQCDRYKRKELLKEYLKKHGI